MKKEKREKKNTVYLKCPFSEEQLRDFSKTLARTVAEIEDAENRKKEIVDTIKAEISGYEAKQSTLSRNINQGYEYRTVDVIEYLDEPEAGKKKIVRQDTLEIVAITELTPEDRQELLFDEEK